MATLKTTLALHDGMSSKLRTINGAMSTLITNIKAVENASHGTTQAVRKMTSGMGKGFGAVIANTRQLYSKLSSQLTNIKSAIDLNTKSVQNFNNQLKTGCSHANTLWNLLRRGTTAYFGIQGARGVLNTADKLTMSKAKLKYLSGGSPEMANQVSGQVYSASMRSGGNYLEMLNSVTKLAMQAGDVFNGGTEEIIGFLETFNKMSVVSGSTADEVRAAMQQITQSLASGKFGGDELRTVRESAPLVFEAIANAMGKSKAELAELADKGKITGQQLKAGILNATESIDKQFNELPITWGRVWQTICNYTIKLSEPILAAISAITSNKRFIAFANEVGNIMVYIGLSLYNAFNALKPVLNWLYDSIAGIYNFFKNNWSLIAPIVLGLATAFGLLKLATMAYNGVMLISAARTSMVAFFQGVAAAKAALATGATWAQVAAQWGLNTALYACPLTWVVVAIIAVIAVIYLAVAALNKFAGTSLSATGIVMGAFYTLGAYIWNQIAFIWNTIASLAEFFVNVWNEPMYSVKKLFVNLANLCLDMCIAMTKGWDEMATNFANAMIDAVNGVLEGWNWLIDKLGVVGEKLGLGKATMFKHTTSITSTYEAAKSNLESSIGAKPQDYWEAPKMDMKSLGGAWDKGYSFGEGLSNKIEDVFSGDGIGNFITEALGGSLSDGLNDIGNALSKNFGNNPALNNIASDVGDIKDGVSEISDEELSFMKDMAEREAINRYTLTDLKVEVKNDNNIYDKVDMDEMLYKIQKSVYDGVMGGASGIYT